MSLAIRTHTYMLIIISPTPSQLSLLCFYAPVFEAVFLLSIRNELSANKTKLNFNLY